MSLTIEFYSAGPQELVEIFSSEEYDDFFDELKKYPVADFSLHLSIPEDLDNLCQILRNYNNSIPSIFRDIFDQQLWSDDAEFPSESLTLINENFVNALANLLDNDIEEIAHAWAKTFPEPYLILTNLLKSLLDLHNVAKNALEKKQSLILRLLGI